MTWDKPLAKKYFEGKKVLVVDQNLNSGRSLRKLLSTHGLQSDLILVSAHFEEAKKLIDQFKPHFLITDAELGVHSGLELVQHHLKVMPNRIEGTTILMTPESSASNLGTLAEAQVDAVLIKPYTIQTLEACMTSAFGEKLNPPSFLILFEEAKTQFRTENYEESDRLCHLSIEQNAKFPPAYALQAQVSVKLNDMDRATALLKKGLQIDPDSFLCMNGLFDLYMSQKNYESAYSTAEVLHQKYPPSANRLLDLVKLSIYCAKFEDIITYCNHFKTLDTHDTHLNRAFIAALLTASKYFRTRERGKLGTDVLKDASRISARTNLLQGEVLRYLIENSDLEMADQFYVQMTEENRQKPETILLRMELLYQFDDLAQLMGLGQGLVKEKQDTPRVYELMIEASRKMNRSEQAIQNLILEAQTRHPHLS